MMQEKSDSELIGNALKGDARAFSVLVERHYMLMYKAAYKWCGTRADAQDIAQDAAIKLAENLHSFRFESAFTTWLYRLVINVAKDYMRKKNLRDGRELGLYEDMEMESGASSQEDQMAAREVMAALYDLPEKLRDAVLLVCCEGLSHKEAGEILDCAEATVSWRVHEARKQLNNLIEKGGTYDRQKAR